MEQQKILRFLNIKEHINYWLRFIRFSIVGLLNVLISTILYYMLLNLNLSYIIANTIAYGVGMINSYILSKRWVFKCQMPIKNTLPRFIIVNLITLISANALLYLIVEILKLDIIVAQPMVTLIVLSINYIGNRIWTFKK